MSPRIRHNPTRGKHQRRSPNARPPAVPFGLFFEYICCETTRLKRRFRKTGAPARRAYMGPPSSHICWLMLAGQALFTLHLFRMAFVHTYRRSVGNWPPAFNPLYFPEMLNMPPAPYLVWVYNGEEKLCLNILSHSFSGDRRDFGRRPSCRRDEDF